MYLFTSESVSEGHPDKVADQISDAILDAFLAQDHYSHVAIETMVTTGQVIIAGEVKSNAYVDVQNVARNVIRRIGYTKSEYQFDADSCGILSAIHEQSQDIDMGVEKKGAGDQGMMFGYAVNETDTFMPLPIYLAHGLMKVLTDIRKEGKVMKYLRPDAKSQVTVKYEGKKPIGIDTIVISTQHDDFASEKAMHERIENDIRLYVLPELQRRVSSDIANLVGNDIKLLVNPTGKFVIGGPHGDTGLTGRKIIVDTYGGRGAHGGGAFSGKDPTKVDRSAAYMARYIAKNMVAAGVSDEMLVQLAYAIGVAEPVSVYVNTNGTNKTAFRDNEIANYIRKAFDLTPQGIIDRFDLLSPIYGETASLGHFGRKAGTAAKTILGEKHIVKLFPWERLDAVEPIRRNLLA